MFMKIFFLGKSLAPNSMTVSNLEREAIIKGISSGLRFDGRSFESYRSINFEFSLVNRGNVTSILGRTR